MNRTLSDSSSFDKNVENYLRTKKILVLDGSGSTRSQLTKLLAELGSDRNNIYSTGDPGEAKSIVEENKIQIVMTEFEIEKVACLPLFEKMISDIPDAERILIMVTRNSQQSAVAQAMEGQVDAYVIKPFVFNYIKESIHRVVSSKANPTKFQKQIHEAGEHIRKKSYFLAEPILIDLVKKQKKPAMALYLYGELFLGRNDSEKAKAFFKKALSIHPNHFKSQNAIYNILFSEKNYPKALESLEGIRKLIPLSPQKLEQLFQLYIYNSKFEKIVELLADYRDLENKPASLVTTAIYSLITSAKHFVSTNQLDLAHESFYTAIGFSGFDFKLISSVCEYLIEKDQHKLAEFMLAKTKHEERDTENFMNLDFLLSMKIAGDNYVLSRAKELVKLELANSRVYFELIRVSLKNNKLTNAEQVLSDARRAFPEQKELWERVAGQIHEGYFELAFTSPEAEQVTEIGGEQQSQLDSAS